MALASALLLGLLNSCGPVTSTFMAPATPHARYADGLRSAGLASSAWGRAWAEAAQLALADCVVVALPFAETAYFPAERPRALGYRIRPQRGEHIYVSVSGADAAQVQIFLDVLEQRDGDPELRPVTSATDSLAVDWEGQEGPQLHRARAAGTVAQRAPHAQHHHRCLHRLPRAGPYQQGRAQLLRQRTRWWRPQA